MTYTCLFVALLKATYVEKIAHSVVLSKIKMQNIENRDDCQRSIGKQLKTHERLKRSAVYNNYGLDKTMCEFSNSIKHEKEREKKLS